MKRRLSLLLLLACLTPPAGVPANAGLPAAEEDEWAQQRARMVRRQIEARGVEDERLLAALLAVPRHELVPEPYRHLAYADHPLPIGYDQTISQPYIVAYMTEKLALEGGERVLEVGTGSGYQAAVLAHLAREVYTIEIVPELAARASADLERLGYENVHVREGDGYRGWPEKAPFDAILIAAAPPRVPEPLLEQLAVGGRMILPVGETFQELILITRDEEGLQRERLIPVRFVPMTGEVRQRP